MPVDRVSMMGIFDSESLAAAAIRKLRQAGYALERVHSPIPSRQVADALGAPKSKVGWFTLAGGVTGFICGFWLAAFTALRWDIMVGGKPVVAWVPFFVVAFEFTILFAVFGNIVGLITHARLPRVKTVEWYDPRFSGDRFGVLASCPEKEQERLLTFFKECGAEIKG